LRRGVSRQLVAIATLAWINGAVALRRAPLWIIAYLTMPLTLLFFSHVYGGEVGLRFALIGGVLMVAVSNGIALLGDAAFYRIYVKYQDMLVASPIRPTSYIIGLSLSMLVFSMPGLALFVVLLGLQGMLTPLFSAALFACLVMVWASSSFMGFAISTAFRQLKHVWPLATILAILLSVLPPIYYPATVLPQGFEWIGALVPSGAAAMLLHQVAGLVELSQATIAVSAVLLVAYTVAFMILSATKVRWREK